MTTGALAQRGTVVQPPPPDFSRLPDPGSQTSFNYQPFDKTPLKFSSTTINILVPVVVTDKEGRPVKGLKKEDFHVFENGKEQKLVGLEEVKTLVTPIQKVDTPKNVATNEGALEAAPRRMVIIALDMVNTPFLDQYRARHALLSYLAENIDPDAVYQLVSIENNGMRVLHDYTQDTKSLVEALGTVKSRMPTTQAVDQAALSHSNNPAPGPDDLGRPQLDLLADYLAGRSEGGYAAYMDAAAVRSTLAALQQIAARVSGIPGRKSLVWITGGFPFSVDPSSGEVNEGLSFAAYQHTMQMLSNQMISMYPIDVRGLLTLGPDSSFKLNRRENATMNAVLADESNRQRDILETMRAFADMTGGRAFVNTNDTTGAIREAANDGAIYYMLSYPLDKSDKRPGWRKISVKVGDYRVRARKGYYLTQTTIDPVASAKLDIDTALTSPYDYTGLPLKLVYNPPTGAGDKKKVTFSMTMPPNSTTVDNADGNHIWVEIAYALISDKGKDAGHKGTAYNLKLNDEQLKAIASQGLSYGDTVEVAPGNYHLHVVVRDNLSGKIGSVATPIKVD